MDTLEENPRNIIGGEEIISKDKLKEFKTTVSKILKAIEKRECRKALKKQKSFYSRSYLIS